MFRNISRLLRNNHIIRILAICEIITLVSFIPVFAQPTTQDINGMTQTVYNFTLWSDFTTNVDAYYGSQIASYSDTTITTIARWLNQIKYYYADQTQTLYMYVPSTNTIQSVTGRHIPEILSYLNYNMAQDAKMNYESELLLSRIVTQMGGTNGSYVQDIALDIDAYLPSLTELTNIKNALNNMDWEYLNFEAKFYDSNFNRIYPSNWTNIPSPIYVPWDNYNRGSYIYRVSLPITYRSNYSDYSVTVGFYQGTEFQPIESLTLPYIYGTDYLFIPSLAAPSNLYFKIESSAGLQYTTSINTNSVATLSRISSDKKDYYTLYQLIQNNNIVDSLNNINVNTSFDDSNIIDAINSLSLQDNDVKLNLTINNNTGSDSTSVINRLQNFFNTGTSISDFFDNVDDAESGWFTQTNSDLINTLSGGYVNLYE